MAEPITAELTLNPRKLKAVRKDRKLVRPKLAKLTGLTERQIAGLEGAGKLNTSLPKDLLLRLSLALQVSQEALTGDGELSEQDLAQQGFQSGGCGCSTSGCCG